MERGFLFPSLPPESQQKFDVCDLTWVSCPPWKEGVGVVSTTLSVETEVGVEGRGSWKGKESAVINMDGGREKGAGYDWRETQSLPMHKMRGLVGHCPQWDPLDARGITVHFRSIL